MTINMAYDEPPLNLAFDSIAGDAWGGSSSAGVAIPRQGGKSRGALDTFLVDTFSTDPAVCGRQFVVLFVIFLITSVQNNFMVQFEIGVFAETPHEFGSDCVGVGPVVCT